jgi:hypothetical protein
MRPKEKAMSKVFAPLALCTLLLSSTGCHMLRPPVQEPEAAWNTYQGRLAEQCSEKHLDKMPGEKLNDLAVESYKDADTQVQQLIDLDTVKACKSSGDRNECYNTGFIQASIQAGTLQEFVKKVCSKS